MKLSNLLLAALIFLLAGCKDQELITDLDQNQANEIIALLQRNNIPAIKKTEPKQGYRIMVNNADFPVAVDLMHSHDLPSRPRVEIAQMFPADSLISSPLAEQARLNSAIEQRLEQSLLVLKGVVSARLHVSYGISQQGESKNNPMPRISVLVRYQRDEVDATVLIGDIKRFLLNSVDRADYDNISVVLSPQEDIEHVMPQSQKEQGSMLTSALLGVMVLLITLAAAGWYLLRKRTAASKVQDGQTQP